jgi:hypothetical protein
MSLPNGFFDGALRRILELQRPDGAIPWFDIGVWDPWNHTEAAMGLAVLGRVAEARRAYDHLADTQESDGSWWAHYGSAVHLETGRYEGSGNEPRKRDTNFCAYPATGIWHLYLVTRDRAVLARYWPARAGGRAGRCAADGQLLDLQKPRLRHPDRPGPGSRRARLDPRPGPAGRGDTAQVRTVRPHLAEQGQFFDGLVLPCPERGDAR